MRLGYTVGVIFGCVVVVLAAITVLLPSEIRREGSTTVCASPSASFEAFNDLERVGDWSSIFGSVEPERREVTGPVGEQSQLRIGGEDQWLLLSITESLPPERVEYVVDTDDGLGVNAGVTVEAGDTGSRLTLSFHRPFETFWGRWSVVFLGSSLEDLIEKELSHVSEHLAETAQACNATES
jgi:hypothetical protein